LTHLPVLQGHVRILADELEAARDAEAATNRTNLGLLNEVGMLEESLDEELRTTIELREKWEMERKSLEYNATVLQNQAQVPGLDPIEAEAAWFKQKVRLVN
jgi:hypothetical protein